MNSAVPQPLAQLAEAGGLRQLDPKTLRFSRHGAWVRLELDDITHRTVTIARIFPLTEPNRFLSIRDSANAEIGVLTDPDALDAASRECVLAELHRRYLCPRILRIVKITERFGTVDWSIKTDRGPRQFATRDLRENVVRLAGGRFLISDIEGNRFDVPDIHQLDATSRALLIGQL
jgi:hypothetical protein